MTMTFEKALDVILKLEGGYVNNPEDPGGETNMGITKKTAERFQYFGPMLEIPIEIVKTIYFKEYWLRPRCDSLPTLLRLAVFDTAVNSGISMSVKLLQKAVYTDEDGLIGTQTMRAIADRDPHEILLRYLAFRIRFLTNLETWPSFGKGWANRIAIILLESSQS